MIQEIKLSISFENNQIEDLENRVFPRIQQIPLENQLPTE